MGLWADLPQADKDAVNALAALLRAWAGEQARANNHADAINTQWIANVSAIVMGLDAAQVIPNVSGLAGATDLTRENFISIVAHAQNMLTDMSTHTTGFNTAAHRQLWVLACGADNLTG